MGTVTIEDYFISWSCKEGNVNETDELIKWIEELNKKTYVSITENSIYDSDFWFYDDYKGEVLNRKRSFFSIIGMRYFVDKEFIKEQPIIVQPEIGYLGIICKKIDGVLNFLMQAKIEPGNVNCVQISPTIQATKSNFMRAHGGKLPTYFEYFERSSKYEVIYDQVQSEQASRFYKKRNRNMIMVVNDELDVYENYKWMTLGQIKSFMRINNLVNMDTRTVLSGLPLSSPGSSVDRIEDCQKFFVEKEMACSFLTPCITEDGPRIFQLLNNYKMFHDVIVSSVPLNQLVDWKVDEYGISCKRKADFCVKYYDIEIDGREVHKWTQPLFVAIGNATFGLVMQNQEGRKKVLVRIKPEIGAFDKIELGPTVQWEPTHSITEDNGIDEIFRKLVNHKANVKLDVMLSEEGGRFYHEENRNLIVEAPSHIKIDAPDGYYWTDYGTLCHLIQMHSCINIQLRNLVSLVDL